MSAPTIVTPPLPPAATCRPAPRCCCSHGLHGHGPECNFPGCDCEIYRPIEVTLG